MREVECNDWRKVDAITKVPDGPESLLFGLRRYPFVSINKISVAEGRYEDLQQYMEQITKELGEAPLTSVFCNAGIYRSQVIAEALDSDRLIQLSQSNTRGTDQVLGCGNERVSYGFDFSEYGLVMSERDPRSLEVLLLNLSLKRGRIGDRKTMTKIGLMLDEGLEEVTKRDKRFDILWLDGEEDDYLKWFPE